MSEWPSEPGLRGYGEYYAGHGRHTGCAAPRGGTGLGIWDKGMGGQGNASVKGRNCEMRVRSAFPWIFTVNVHSIPLPPPSRKITPGVGGECACTTIQTNISGQPSIKPGWRMALEEGRTPCRHVWGRLYCPARVRGGCMISVFSTPRVPENHADYIRRQVRVADTAATDSRESPMNTYQFDVILAGRRKSPTTWQRPFRSRV